MIFGFVWSQDTSCSLRIPIVKTFRFYPSILHSSIHNNIHPLLLFLLFRLVLIIILHQVRPPSPPPNAPFPFPIQPPFLLLQISSYVHPRSNKRCQDHPCVSQNNSWFTISPNLSHVPCFISSFLTASPCRSFAATYSIARYQFTCCAYHTPLAIDDPHKIVKVIASDGRTGDTKEISYSNCKIIGNGSFGVVYQAKLVGPPKDGDDIAIKKVLQDKRFKVRFTLLRRLPVKCRIINRYPLWNNRTASSKL